MWSGLPVVLTQPQEYKVSYILLIAPIASPVARETKINYKKILYGSDGGV
jgi:hypothetical protein